MPSGWDPLLGKDEIEGFGVRALDDMSQITDHILLPEGRMDSVIVAVVHDEFRGMGLSGVSGSLGEGAVFDGGNVDFITQIWDISGDSPIPARKMDCWTVRFGRYIRTPDKLTAPS